MYRLLNRLFSIDLRSLAAFRAVAGCIVLVDLAVRSTALTAFYTDAGVVPRSLLPTGRFPSLHSLGGSAEWEGFLFLLAAAAAASLIIGWQTRLAAFASWYLLASLQTRDMIVLNAGDSLLRMMLFWGMFLPLGEAWSLDARRRGSGSTTRTSVLSVASACLLLQTCLMYLVSAEAKYNEVWRDGDALYYTFSYDAYARPLATYMLNYPSVLRILSVATLGLEAFGPLLAFLPWRTKFWRLLVIAAFVGLHLSIELTLTVGLFSYVSLLAWIPFLPDVFWNKLAGPPAIVDEATNPALAIGPVTCRWPARLTSAVCLLAFGYVLLYCYSTTSLPGAKAAWLKSVSQLAPKIMLQQHWGMFGRPTRFDGWCVASARLADGTTVDLLRGGTPLDWEKPDRVANIHPNHRWRKYFGQLPRTRNQHYRPALCQYLARLWDETHPDEQQVLWLDLYQIKEWTPKPGEPLEYQRILLHHERIAAQGAFAEAAAEQNAEPTEALDDLPPGL